MGRSNSSEENKTIKQPSKLITEINNSLQLTDVTSIPEEVLSLLKNFLTPDNIIHLRIRSEMITNNTQTEDFVTRTETKHISNQTYFETTDFSNQTDNLGKNFGQQCKISLDQKMTQTDAKTLVELATQTTKIDSIHSFTQTFLNVTSNSTGTDQTKPETIETQTGSIGTTTTQTQTDVIKEIQPQPSTLQIPFPFFLPSLRHVSSMFLPIGRLQIAPLGTYNIFFIK